MTLKRIIYERYIGPRAFGDAPSNASVILKQLDDYAVRVDNERNSWLLLDIPSIRGGRLEIFPTGEQAIFRYLEGENEEDIRQIRDALKKADMQRQS